MSNTTTTPATLTIEDIEALRARMNDEFRDAADLREAANRAYAAGVRLREQVEKAEAQLAGDRPVAVRGGRIVGYLGVWIELTEFRGVQRFHIAIDQPGFNCDQNNTPSGFSDISDAARESLKYRRAAK